jgi:sugar lactone lactonase YvrE
MADAMTIYQDFLDRTGDALVSGDADVFVCRVFLPCTVETDTETIVIETDAVSRRHFAGFHQALMAQGTDAYTRIAKTAVFDGPDCIHGRHETIITSAGKLVAPRFFNDMTIKRRGDIWGTDWVRHHTRYVSFPDVLPRDTGRRE